MTTPRASTTLYYMNLPIEKRAVFDVQEKLQRLGYSGGGEPDGELDKKTEAAILNFRNRNNLPLTPKIDDALLVALNSAPVIELPVEQVTATVAEVAPKVSVARHAWWTNFWAKIVSTPAVLTAICVGIIENLGDAIQTLAPLKSFLNDYLSGVPPLAMVGYAAAAVSMVSLFLWLRTSHAVDHLVEGYQAGTIRVDNPHATEVIEDAKAQTVTGGTTP